MMDINTLDISLFLRDYAITTAILIVVILAAYYFKKQPDAPEGNNLMIGGFFSVILSKTIVFFDYFMEAKFFTFLEIAFVCFASVLFITASLMNKKIRFAGEMFAYILLAIFLSIPLYAVYFTEAQYLLYLIYYFALGIGFSFLAVGFCGRGAQKETFGFNITAIGLFLLALFNFVLITKWGRDTFDSINLFLLLNFFVAIGLVLAGNNLLSDKIVQQANEITAGQERLRLIIQASPFPIVISRLRDDRLILVNRKAEALLGVDITKLSEYKLADFFEDSGFKTEVMMRLEKSNKIDSLDFLLNKNQSSGVDVWLQLSTHIIDFEYEIALYSSFQDITERKKKEIELFKEATRDPLTGAYTRRFFEEVAEKEIQRSVRYNRPFCLAMIDADHFKNVNDTYGHAVGDKVLKELVATCEKVLRKTDIICRFGGEEFLILLLEIDLAVAQVVTDRLRAIISNIIINTDSGQEVRFTVSIGLVPSTYSTNYDELVKAVDEALYVAKNSGRNRVVALAPQISSGSAKASGGSSGDEGLAQSAPSKKDAEPKPVIEMLAQAGSDEGTAGS
jgi:diguanylate cyclase (GGDEF)-like protein/PAS domain S-box-containing protein